MELNEINDLLSRINGATFASLDAETEPSPGIRKVTIGERVMLFTNKGGSAYGKMVQRRLMEAGLNPLNFVLGDLPWGERVEGTPLILHKGRYYVQCIVLDSGVSTFFIGGIRSEDPSGLRLSRRRSNQGLCRTDEVIVSTYRLENITRLRLLGEERIAGKLHPKFAQE